MLRNNWNKFALILILLLGGVVRFWGNTRGLPELYVHDEIFEVNRALQLLRGYYDFYRPMKGFFFYILAIIYAVYGFVATAIGSFDSIEEFISYSIVSPGQMIYLSRFTSASLGTLSIYLLYRLGYRLFPKSFYAPVLLALAWSTCWLAVWIANWGFVETCLVTLGILAFFPICNVLERGARRDYIIAGIIIAMATSTKIYGAVLLVALWLAHFSSGTTIAFRSRMYRVFDKNLFLSMLVFFTIWMTLDPSFVILILTKCNILQHKILYAENPDFIKEQHLMFYIKILRWNVGNFLIPFVFLGISFALWKRENIILIISCMSIIFLSIIGLKKENIHVYPRYALLILPYVFILGIYGVIEISELLKNRMQKNLGVILYRCMLILVSLLISYNGTESLAKSRFYNESFIPVEKEAKEWFEKNIPSMSKVVMNGEIVWPGHQTIPIYNTSQNYLSLYNSAAELGKYFKNMEVLPILANAEGIKRYDLTVIDRHDKWEGIDFYIRNGTDYFVIRKDQFLDNFVNKYSTESQNSRVKVYKEIKSSKDIKLIKEFQGKTLQGVEKTIQVFKVTNDEASKERMGRLNEHSPEMIVQ